MDALINRIQYEEEVKQKTCAVIGCQNKATHTWSGHPTCDECATPNRTSTPFPNIIDRGR